MDKKVRPAMMTVDQAHSAVGKENISRAAFYAAVQRNEIPNVRLGKRILIPRHPFEKWLETAGAGAGQVT